MDVGEKERLAYMKQADIFFINLLTIIILSYGCVLASETNQFNGLVWKIYNNEKDSYLIFFKAKHPMIIPGSAVISINVLDDKKNHQRTVNFSTGNRTDIVKAEIQKVKEIGLPVIAIQIVSQTSNHQLGKQFYGLIDDRIALIRVEDSAEQIHQLNYAYGVPLGPPHPKWDIETLKMALSSKNPFEVLEALTWLGGIHASHSSIGLEMIHEPLADINLFTLADQSKSIQNIIKKLMESDIKWVCEAASLVMN